MLLAFIAGIILGGFAAGCLGYVIGERIAARRWHRRMSEHLSKEFERTKKFIDAARALTRHRAPKADYENRN
jgi:membrane protein DedA with SNARE-associated domain